MVKNTTGGKGSKGYARKNEITSSNKLRLSQHSDEVYAFVIKALGNCMFHVKTEKHNQLLLHLRGKFSGRNKRNNFVSVGSFVLVGLRDLEKPNYKECDLLEIYTDQEVKRLVSFPECSFFSHISVDSINNNQDNQDDDIIFTNKEVEIIQTKIEKEKNSIEEEEEEEINIDEI
jgi:translation initiation factor IF-1